MSVETEASVGSCKIGEIIRKAEQDYRAGNTSISKYVEFDMLGTLDKIDAYHYSKHTSGPTDSLGREKPFFNIVTAAENIWYRATDIDRGQIKVKATKTKNVIDAFLATVHIQEWMRKENFGVFLNEWGRALSRYGSSVVKFVEKDGKLHRMVVPWQTIICDSVDFENNPVIEALDLTESQLRSREGYNQDLVEALCEAKTSRKLPDGTDKDNKSDYIRVYEIHGEFPLAYLTAGTDKYQDSDQDTYVQQMQVLSFVTKTDTRTGATYFEDYVLAKGREEQSPYLLTHLIREEGRTLGIGPVEGMFDAQWMQNHSVKAIKDQLDLASKLIFQTSDGTFVGQNALSAIETGDILIHKINEPITQVANNSHDVASWQSFGNQWKAGGGEIAGINQSMLGNTAPSGTAWRQVEALLSETHDLFDLMEQNKGLAVEEMFRRFVINFIKKQMDTSEEVSATLDSYDITKIDSIYIKNYSTFLVNQEIVKRVFNNIEVTPEDQANMMSATQNSLREGLSQLGNQRFFKPSEISTKTWKEQFKDLEWDITVDVTGENVDKDAMTTLNTILSFFAKKQGQPLSPEEKFALNKIYMQTGAVSALEMSSLASPAAPVIPSPMSPSAPPVPVQ